MEATDEHAFHVVAPEEWLVCLLDAKDFIVAEPIRLAFFVKFMEELGIELVVVDGGRIVDELSVVDSDADVAS